MAYPPVLSKREWPFSPQALPNCVLWLDAADTSTYTAASVAAWRNKGYAYGSTSESGGFTSTNINGIPALSIATNATRTAPSATYTQTTRTVFSVTNSIPAAYATGIITSITNTTDIQMFITSSGILNIQKIDTQLMTTNTNIQPVLSKPAICCATTTNTSSPSGATQGIFINGTSYALFVNNTESFGTTTTTSQSIGWSNNAKSFTLGEVLIFDGALTDIQRQQVEGYLAVKWGLQSLLPSSHPYYSSPLSPLELPGCVLWLDAADTSTYNAASVSTSTWRNKGTSGGNTTTLTSCTATTINSIPSINIASNSIRFSSTYTTTERTTFIVAIPSATGVFFVDSPNNIYMKVYTNTISNNVGTVLLQTSANPSITLPTIFAFRSTASSTTNGIFYNGASQTLSTNTTYSWIPGTEPRHVLTNSSGNYNLGEMIFFDGALTDTQRQQVEGYLARKWAITLPSPHPYNSIIRSIAVANRPFQPVDIAGCQLWLDAADATTIVGTASDVTGWKDKSGSGYSASKYSVDTGTITTSTSPNGLPTLLLTNNRMTISNVTLNVAQTVFIVCKYNSSAYISLATQGTNPLIGGNLWYYMTANWNLYNDNAGFGTWDLSYATINPTNRTTIYPVNNWLVLCLGYNLGTTLSHYTINGTSRIQYLAASSAVSAGTNTGVYVINGVSQGNGGILTIGEMLHYNRSISVSERLQIESYLAQKWGLQSALPPTPPHPGRFLPSYSTVFTPKSVSDLALWLDAADRSTITIPEESSFIDAWADKSGSGYIAQKNSSDGYPYAEIVTIDRRTGVGIANGRMYIPNFFWNNRFTQFIVANTESSITTSITNSQSTVERDFYLSTGNVPLVNDFGSQTSTRDQRYVGSLPGTINTWVIFCIGYDLGSTLSHYTLNGVSSISELFPDFNNMAPLTNYFQINPPPNIDTLQTTYGEILHYNRSLTVNERQQVEGYLAWKWGLASNLPSTHPYAKFSP